MKLPAFLQRRIHWLNLPSAILMMLLQRTPAATLVAVADEIVAAAPLGNVLRSAFAAAAALGAVNAVVGATQLSATSGSDTGTNVTVGQAVTVLYTVTGTQAPPQSWRVTGNFPPGLNFSGLTSDGSVNIESLRLSGTPTTAGSYSVTITAYQLANQGGSVSPPFDYTVTVAAGNNATAPSFTTQPANQTVTAGNSVTFTSAASGDPAPTFQWRKDGNNIAGATNASFTIASAAAGDAGSYTVVATNSAGSVTSNAATLTVNAAATAPSFTTQPANQTVTAGNSVTFTSAASGDPAPTFQWRKDGNAIAGATNASFTIASAAAGDAGSYTVVATNSAGSVTSNAATLTVNAAPVGPEITSSPSGVFVALGGTATFTVAATGNPAPTFQWRKDGNNIAGATNATLTIANVTQDDVGHYTAAATNSAGTVISGSATLTITTTAATHLADQTISAGGSTAFDAGAQSGSTQWQISTNNGTTWTDLTDTGPYSGASTVVLTITNAAQTLSGAQYRFVNSANGIIATSNAATLTVTAAPVAPSFTTQPTSQTSSTGTAATFTAAASGNPAPTYQWRKDGNNIAGATGATFSIPSVATSDVGTYTVVATNSQGSVTSNAATLTVSTTAARRLNDVTVTSGHGTTLTAGNTAGAIRWQISTNNGSTWADLTDGGSYAGTATATLTISNVGSSLTGAQYRFVATNNGVVSVSNGAALTVATVFFPFPTGIAVDASGGLVVADANANTVQKISSTNQVSLLAGMNNSAGTADGTGAAARFNQPNGVVALAGGGFVVTDTANATIRSIDANGAVTTLAGASATRGGADGTGAAATFSAPVGIARDAAGVLFVADSMNHTIRRIAAGGVVTTFAGTAGAQGTTDAAGSAARFNLPNGVAVDATGVLFVADTTNNTIRRIGTDGAVTTLAGLPGVSGFDNGTGMAALFNRPMALVIDGAGNLFVADTGNSTIRKVTPAGVVTTFAGTAGIAGIADGADSEALFNQPQALAIDATGNLYVADTGNAAIRKITPAGVVSTLAFTAAPVGGGGGGGGGGGSVPPPPSSGGGYGGGGGGAPSVWLPLSATLLLALRYRRRSQVVSRR